MVTERRTLRLPARTTTLAALLATFASTSVADTWHYLSGGKLSGISSVGSQVWTVGQDGLFFYSEDNGATWRRIPRFTTRNLVDVEFWDTNLGLITAEGDVVYRTTNNGATWDSAHVSYSSGKVRFLSEDLVWLTEPGYALRSLDGGLTWDYRTGGNAFWFLDSLNGWTDNRQRLRRTSDGGRTWIDLGLIPSPGLVFNRVECIAFSTPDAGFCNFGYCYGTRLFYPHWEWVATFDGGQSWSRCTLDVQAGTSCDVDPCRRVYGLDKAGCSVFFSGQKFRFNFGLYNSATDVSAARGERSWACGSGGQVWSSRDSGLTWQRSSSGTASGLKELVFPDSVVGYALNSRGVVRTTDAGRSWAPALTLSTLRGSGFVGLSSPEPAVLFATDDDIYPINYLYPTYDGYFRIRQSLDSGRTWAPVCSRRMYDETPVSAQRLSFFDRLHGWHPGSRGIHVQDNALRTTDGGATWLHMTDGLGSDVSFVDTAHGWMTDGNLKSSTNSGDTWVVQRPSLGFARLQMMNLGVGMALSSSGLWRTDNGGDSWTLSLAADSLSAFHFCNGRFGVAVGRHRRIFRTSDSGHTWVRDTCEFTSNLNAVFMLDSAHAWAAGDNGLVLGLGDWASGVEERREALSPVGWTGIEVWPNPCRDAVNFSVGYPGRFQLRLYDAAGRAVLSRASGVRHAASSIPLDLRALPSGVYFASVRSGRSKQTVRLVKVR